MHTEDDRTHTYPNGKEGFDELEGFVYGIERWAMEAVNMQRPERTEKMMIRWMCGVKLSDRKANAELLIRLGIEGVSAVIGVVD